jgi:hypothetical protein
MITQAESAGAIGEGIAVDKFGTGFGKRTFIVAGELFVKLFGEDEAKDGVTEKFQALIMGGGHAAFMRERGMGQRQAQ